MDALLDAAASSAASSPLLPLAPPPAHRKPPSFLSPEPVAVTARDHMQRTLSEGARKKQQKRKLHERTNTGTDAQATPTIIKRKKKLLSGDTPQSASADSIRGKENEPNATVVTNALVGVGMVDKPRQMKFSEGNAAGETATRRLDFVATPSKPEKKRVRKELQPESSSSSSSEDEDGDHSSASSDECEVAFDTVTLGNLGIVREAISSSSSPSSTVSNESSKPIGLEYQFAVSSTVSSIAVAPNGKFLVVGFYNGTIYLYPLTQDSLRYRHGVMLDHISARGMYTQLMVRVSLPEDGKFIFAGVYRGSTEIRAFEVDSIELPSLERLAQAATSRGTDESGDDSDNDEATGVPSARVVSHTYSDAKLKGFSDVKSVVKKTGNDNKTEYHLLCGLGIKNIHMWRFYHDDTANEWAWECIFDKQNNGISIEMLCFHRAIDYQIIAKSEHQNVRIWNLEDDSVSGMLKKKSHIDIKQTVDATAVYGDHAYGGGEALALIDLSSSSRMELDLPLSVKEQEAKQANARMTAGTRITASLRGRRGTRGRGSADDATNSQRLMRMVSQVAGQDAAPFVVGMCTDGSVFMHHPQPETMGLATPLEYVEGYEQYFQDPSLSFQAQFSDLTRVNTSGLLAVLPLPKTEQEEWMVVAANANQLLVRSMEAFLHRNQQKQEHGRVKRGLRSALREMGNNASSSESDSNDESSSEDDEPIIRKLASRVSVDAVVEGKQEKPPKVDPRKEETKAEKNREAATAKPEKMPKVKVNRATPPSSTKAQPLKPSSSNKPLSEQTGKPLPLAKIQSQTTDEILENKANTSLASTPVRTDRFTARSLAVPSPVVSISSPSASSNPNTPERIKRLSEDDRRALVINDLEWTPQASAPKTDNQAADVSKNGEPSHEPSNPTKRGRSQKSTRKLGKGRSKGVAQALFINDETESNQKAETPAVQTSVSLKRPAEELLQGGPQKKLAVASDEASAPLLCDEECSDVEDACEDTFSFTPLLSDGGSLLAAAIYQYSPTDPSECVTSSRQFSADEIQLMMRFASQEERLKRSYTMDRERILRQFTMTECDCGAKKKAASNASKFNWRKQVASEASKKKHMKRRQKKLLAARLRDLQTSYEGKLSDIQIIQRLELQAFTARQEFQLLAAQI